MSPTDRDGAVLRRIALLSVHTSPLDRPGTGDGGGLNVYVREVATRLAARGVHVDVFTRRADRSVPDVVELSPGVDVHHVEAGPPRRLDKDEVANHLCAFVLALQRHPTGGSHDLVHAHYWLAGWVGRRVARGWDIPLVQTFHTLSAMKNATLAPGDLPESPLRVTAEARIARSADRVLVLTCGEARLLHRTYGLSGGKLTVVPPGVDLDRFHPNGAASRHAPAAGWAPQLLFAGRLQPLKGPDLAIRILAEVRRSVPAARLRIVGGESGTANGATSPRQLADLASQLGVANAVEFEPALDQDDLADRYREADVVLVPSRSETFGLVALEAQASGTPVVAADVPGLEAVVGDGGTLVTGHDPADHAAAVVTYLTDPAAAASAGAAGIAVASRATWDKTVVCLLDAYRDIVATHAVRSEPPTDAVAV